MNWNPPDPWVIVGRIGRPVGLDGSVRVWAEADLPPILEEDVPLRAWNEREGPLVELRAVEARDDPRGWVVRWEGFETRESTVRLRNAWIVAKREDLPEPEDGSVYFGDLLGSQARSREGRRLGVVVDFVESAAHAVVEVRKEDGSGFLIPLTEEVDARLERAVEKGAESVLWVTLPEGLEEATEIVTGNSVRPKERRPARRGRPGNTERGGRA